MSEYLLNLSPKELQRRADSIIEGHKIAFTHGLKPQEINQLRAGQLSLYEYQDMLLVYLGLKPAAGYLNEISKICLRNKNDFLQFLPQQIDGTQNILHNTLQSNLWNTDLVSSVMESHPSLLSRLILEDNRFYSLLTNPSSPNFASFLRALGNKQSHTSVTLEGLLYGYPKQSAANYFGYYRRLGENINALRKGAIKNNTPTTIPEKFSIASTCLNKGFRNEVIRIANIVELPDDPEFLSFLKSTRVARVPGFPYFTTGNTTNEEERHIRSLYEASQIESKLDKLLKVKPKR